MNELQQNSLVSGPAGARLTTESLGVSLIRKVGNAGMGIDDVVALWYGEPDMPTPDYICQATAASLARGETFYTENFGIDELRQTLSAYMSNLYGRHIDTERVAVTASGTAFGERGEGFIRLCFASTLARLDDAMDRIEPFFS
ncbi:MAG: hypothetical protein VCF08_17315 [Alphaproteobacteria bacterium]